MDHQDRKAALRRYIVFRVKAIEFMDMNAMWQAAKAGHSTPNPVGRTPQDFADSLRTVQLSWFALLVDKGEGLNSIELWCALFPEHEKTIRATWSQLQSGWKRIRKFRNSAGFHADKPNRFFKVRRDVVSKEVDAAMDKFINLMRLVLKEEATTLPDLERATDDLLDDLEDSLGIKYNRSQFKRYLMLPDTSASQTPV